MSYDNLGRGDRHAQQRRRRKNNKDVPVQDKEYKLIDGNYSPQPYAYCCHYKAYMTRNQTKLHECKKRQCEQLKTFEWAQEKGKK